MLPATLEAFPPFSPTYHPPTGEGPTSTDGQGRTWLRVGTVPVETTEEHFWTVMSKWVGEAEIVIPPVLRTLLERPLTREADAGGYFLRRTLLPRRVDKDEVVVEDVEYYRVHPHHFGTIFSPVTVGGRSVTSEDDLPYYYPKVKAYRYSYSQEEDGATGELRIDVLPFASVGHTQESTRDKMDKIWPRLLRMLFKWLCNAARGYKKRVQHDLLVDRELYRERYAAMRERHAARWIRDWTESTDPQKFIFEDIGIATWILAIWAQSGDSSTHTPFIDIACGNGLLVQILAAEGFPGCGVDMARRKVWDLYDPSTHLRVETLHPPTLSYAEEEAGWLIGNHADELVPWIPVIASRSAYSTKFIIIPCCLYDLAGSRAFTRSSTATGIEGGRYAAYIEYLEGIIRVCGYEVERENLRIPSTRNVALVGRRRTFAEDDFVAAEKIRSDVDAMVRGASLAFVARETDRVKEAGRREKRQGRLARR